ncbi:hypothetical protein ACIXCC_17875, partial [Bacteroides fragilis]
GRSMWIVCITSVRHVLTVNGYGGRQTKENEKSWCFKGWETLVNYRKKRGNRPILKWQCSREGYTENILYPVK